MFHFFLLYSNVGTQKSKTPKYKDALYNNVRRDREGKGINRLSGGTESLPSPGYGEMETNGYRKHLKRMIEKRTTKTKNGHCMDAD